MEEVKNAETQAPLKKAPLKKAPQSNVPELEEAIVVSPLQTRLEEKFDVADKTVPVIRKVFVRPYIDPNPKNDYMGFAKNGLVVFDGCGQVEQLGCLYDNGGHKRWLTGLDEFTPEIVNMKDPDKKAAKIKEIRTKVQYLEKLKANEIDIDDDKFWDKVLYYHPKRNDATWEQVIIRCGNEERAYNPMDPEHLVVISALEAGGFSIVAPSLDDARSSNVKYKWYLDRCEDSAATKVEVIKWTNKALAKLEDLANKDGNRLFYVAKVIDSANSSEYRKNTPNDILYANANKFINAEGVEPNKKKAARTFIEVSEMTMEDLKLKAIALDACFYGHIMHKDGKLHHKTTNVMMGRNVQECIEFMKNPINDDIQQQIQKGVEKLWAE